jgi:hypothetical protein
VFLTSSIATYFSDDLSAIQARDFVADKRLAHAARKKRSRSVGLMRAIACS